MKLSALGRLVRRDLARARRALAGSAFGIAAGTATLVFFLALGLGVRAVLLGEVFPIDRIELEPPKAKDPGLLGLLLGGDSEPTGISPDDVPSPFNIFQSMRIDPDSGVMYDTMIRPKDEAHVDFRAEMDLLVAASACPESGRGQAIRVEIYDE